MALLYLEGFEGFGTTTGDAGKVTVEAQIAEKYSGLYSQGDGPRIYGGWGGGYAFAFGDDLFGDANYIDFTVASLSEVYVGFAYKPPTSPKSNNLIVLRNTVDSKNHLVFQVVEGHLLKVLRSATVLGSIGGVLSPNRWVYIEFYGKVDDAAGAYTIKVNGTTVLSATGVDTRDAGTTATFDVVRLNGTDGDSDAEGSCGLYDDLYILDTSGSAPTNTFLGPIKIEALLPSAAGDNTDFTPSAGSNYAAVDENEHDDDTTYVESGTSGHTDLYNFGNLTNIDGTVFGVQVNCVSKSTVGSIDYKIKAKHSTTEGDSAAITQASSTYAVDHHIFETNPSTTSAWTPSEVDAAQFGQEVV